MRTIHMSQKANDAGDLSLHIPTGKPNVEFDVVIKIRPKVRDWPPGYIDATYGSIDDDTFVRPPQGELPSPPEFD